MTTTRLLSLLVAGYSIINASAATLTWDSSGNTPGTPLQGSGTWNTANTNWSLGGTSTTWNNSNNDVAAFSGSSYTVTVATPITLSGLDYSGSAAPTLTSSTITLTGSAFLNASNVNALFNINSVLTGTNGLTKTGSGQFSINTQATYTGTTNLSGSNLRIGTTNALPTSTFVNNGGSILMSGNSQTVAGLSGAGAIRNTTSGTTSTFTVNGTGTSTYTGQIFDSGTANSVSFAVSGSYTLTLTNAANSYNGSTSVTSAGTLILNSSATNTRSVTISGGTLSSSAGNKILGVGLVSMSAGTINISGTSIGSFTLGANQNLLTTGGTIKFDLGTSFDSIIDTGATGTFSLTNTTLALTTTGTGFSYANTYAIFTGFSTGTTSNLSITGYDTTNFIATLGSNGVLSFASVPEPSTLALIGGAGLAFVALRRRLSP